MKLHFGFDNDIEIIIIAVRSGIKGVGNDLGHFIVEDAGLD